MCVQDKICYIVHSLASLRNIAKILPQLNLKFLIIVYLLFCFGYIGL